MKVSCANCDSKDMKVYYHLCKDCFFGLLVASQKPAPQGCWEAADGSGRHVAEAASADRRGLEELLPCPFCGGKADIIYKDSSVVKTFEYEYVVIECKECHCSTPLCEDINLAYSFWNTRVVGGND